jgi:hypothetical protein
MCSFALSLISALDGVGHQTPHLSCFIPGNETWYPLYMRLGGSQARSGRVRKILSPTGIRSPDRLTRSESLYRLSYPSINELHIPIGITTRSVSRVIAEHAMNIYGATEVQVHAFLPWTLDGG